MHRELTNVRSFVKDKGYETASIDKVLCAVTEDPSQNSRNTDGRASSSTLKADLVREEPHIQIDLAHGSAADLRAMSFPREESHPIQNHQVRTQTSSNVEQNLSSRDAMPPPAMPKRQQIMHKQSPLPGLSELEPYPDYRPPAMNTPARLLRPSDWTSATPMSRTSSRHFPSVETYQLSPFRHSIVNQSPLSSVTPQNRRRYSLVQDSETQIERAPSRIQYGQERQPPNGQSSFELINSPYKRPALGLYASQSPSLPGTDTEITTPTFARPQVADHGHMTEFTRDSSTPRAERPFKPLTYSNDHRKPIASRRLRGRTGQRSMMDDLRTSPSTAKSTYFNEGLQAFAFQGDPVNAYMQQKSLSMSNSRLVILLLLIII